MKVRCIATSLTAPQKEQLRITHAVTADHQLIVGSSYLVLGITFMMPVEPHGGGVRYEILNDFGNCIGIPACLFEIEDARCSRYWLARHKPNGALLIWPEEFFADYFHDDLSEGERDAVDAYQHVVARMQSEFASNPESGPDNG